MNKNMSTVFFTGLMLFSFFFGAGNLILPPMLGLQAGAAFWPAILGFIVTAVTLPVLGIAIVSVSPGGILSVGERVGSRFALAFSIIVYLAIGPLYAIPRAANVGFEIGFSPLLPENTPTRYSLLVFIMFFFGFCYYAACFAGKLVSIVGKILTPILLGIIALLTILAFVNLEFLGSAPVERFAKNPFAVGVVEGYLSMDAIAALAFCSIVMYSLRNNAKDKRSLIMQSIAAGCIAGVCLASIYLALGWIGGCMPADTQAENGAELLYIIAEQLLGQTGRILFGIIVILACMTTCIGLINVCSMFSNQLFPRISYKVYVAIFTILGALCANVGLTQLLALAVPLLIFIYPIAIALMALNILRPWIDDKPAVWQVTVGLTFCFAVHDLFSTLPWKFPLADVYLAWIMPALLVLLVTWGGTILYRRWNPEVHKTAPAQKDASNP